MSWFDENVDDLRKRNSSHAGLIDRLVNVLRDEAEDLVNSAEDSELTRSDIDKIISRLTIDVEPGSSYYMRKILIIILKYAHTYKNWKIAPIPRVTLLRNPRSPITLKSSLLWQSYNAIKTIIKECIAHQDDMMINESVALIFFSMMAYGSLINRHSVNCVLTKNFTHIRHNNNKTLYWMNVSADPNRAGAGVIHRYFIDPTSLLLIKKHIFLHGSNQDDLSTLNFNIANDHKDLYKTIKNVVNKYVGKRSEMPTYISDIYKCIEHEIRYTEPQSLAEYAMGSNLSFSVSEYRFLKLSMSEESVLTDHNDEDIKITGQHEYFETNSFDNGIYEDGLEAIYLYAEILKTGFVSSESSSVYQDLGKDPSVVMVLSWLEKVHAKRNKKRYANFENVDFIDFAVMFYTTSCRCDIRNIENDDIVEIYSQVVNETTSINSLYTTCFLIKDFHNFLNKEYLVCKINFSQIDNFIDQESAVNANIISPNEYIQVCNVINDSSSIQERLKTIRYLIFVVAYRLGLRPGEISRLRLSDIIFTKTKGYAKIVNTEFGMPKSISGYRTHHLHLRLSLDELNTLRAWYKLRLSEAGSSNQALLFTEDVRENRLITHNRVFIPIRNIMRDVTQDDDIKIYALRHTFVTNHLILELPNSHDVYEHIFGESAGFKEFMNVNNRQALLRKGFFRIALNAGHSQPSVFLFHYAHCMDIALHVSNCARQPDYTIHELTGLLGMKKSQLYQRLDKSAHMKTKGHYSLLACLSDGIVSSKLRSCI